MIAVFLVLILILSNAVFGGLLLSFLNEKSSDALLKSFGTFALLACVNVAWVQFVVSRVTKK